MVKIGLGAAMLAVMMAMNVTPNVSVAGYDPLAKFRTQQVEMKHRINAALDWRPELPGLAGIKWDFWR